ncbi:MAG: DUF885 domain-containing protein [Candidatus Eremiobacteraeota bacterium]|nr:DUF885 domain-containing protein [Candidatus Eremiobacteraeota bacterium]
MRLLLLFLVLLTLPVLAQTESEKANALFERAYQAHLERNPEEMSRLGMKRDYGKWTDRSDQFDQEELELTKKFLAELRQSVDPKKLDPQTRLSYDLFVRESQQDIEAFPYRYHNYPVNQMFGIHAEIPTFMANVHSVGSLDDARAYLSRLHGIKPMLAQVRQGLVERERRGILPPRFVFARVLEDCNNILTGAPFEGDGVNVFYGDFEQKVKKLELDEPIRKELLAEARQALLEDVGPAYRDLIALLEQQQARADDRDGAWKLPDGDKFYAWALRRTTTTEMTADEIHNLGLAEVERIHGEMRAIMKKVGFKGTLSEFFTFMREDPRFYYPNTDEGRQQYLSDATAIVNRMKGRLDELFITKPKADMLVKRVEPFRERSAGKAFYETPALDGSRPGYYYANLYNMADMPRYQMEALAFHEGIPGHHMQLSLAQELTGIPKFRKFLHPTAYIEGWGLYCEQLPKEIGFYQDPYSDFGRLAMELFRACRLVVDTGIHSRHWTRQQGIDYYLKNTPNSPGECVKMVERHIVMPSQATAYKVGMIKILELREQARQRQGDKFDLRKFHEVVLTNGPVPLDTLQKLVEEQLP